MLRSEQLWKGNMFSKHSSVHVLCDANTFRHCYPLVHDRLPPHTLIKIPAGEKAKTIEWCENVWNRLMQNGADRNALLINLGGGMICDLGGFAAATYKRGISFINIPTTLLAMVDAAHGGKTALNFGGVKNSVGVFAEPQRVVIHDAFLKTLPSREMCAGMAEMIKHAVIASPALFNHLEKMPAGALPNSKLINQAIGIKQQIVSADYRETGLRKTLNFGHSIGHVLEALALKTKHPLLHGEAVALGMIWESAIAVEKRLLNGAGFERICALIRKHCPVQFVIHGSAASFRNLLRQDKKNTSGRLRMALPSAIGKCRVDVQVTMNEVLSAKRMLSIWP